MRDPGTPARTIPAEREARAVNQPFLRMLVTGMLSAVSIFMLHLPPASGPDRGFVALQRNPAEPTDRYDGERLFNQGEFRERLSSFPGSPQTPVDLIQRSSQLYGFQFISATRNAL